MSLYGVTADQVSEEERATWRLGSRLVYALIVDSHYPGHKDGIPAFDDMIDNLSSYIAKDTNDESIKLKDTVKLFDVIVKTNKPKLLQKILNNPLIPGTNYTDSIAKSSLKLAIRTGSMECLEYLISQNVQIISNTPGDDDKNSYNEIRSLIFNIMQSVNISNAAVIGNKFWSYLAASLYTLYHADTPSDGDEKLDDGDADKGLLNYADTDKADEYMHSKFLITNPLIVCSIYKYIHSSLSGKRYINKLKSALHFVCEHWMVFDDSIDLDTLHHNCSNDKLFDCTSLKSFSIKYNHALLQEYGKVRNQRNVKLFWSEYIMTKLINDYLGIVPSKMNTKKRMDQYGQLNVNKDDGERDGMLYCMKYIVSNGGACQLDDVILPLLDGYRKQFVKNKDDEKEMNVLFEAMEYGKNVWMLKCADRKEVAGLFKTVCKGEIELPMAIIASIICFVVL